MVGRALGVFESGLRTRRCLVSHHGGWGLWERGCTRGRVVRIVVDTYVAPVVRPALASLDIARE